PRARVVGGRKANWPDLRVTSALGPDRLSSAVKGRVQEAPKADDCGPLCRDRSTEPSRRARGSANNPDQPLAASALGTGRLARHGTKPPPPPRYRSISAQSSLVRPGPNADTGTRSGSGAAAAAISRIS